MTTLGPAADPLLTAALAATLLLLLLALVVAYRRGHRNAAAQLQHELDALRRQTLTDPLTGIPNRRAGERLLNQAAETGADLWVAIVDLDDFKPVNDIHGHAAGDHLLQTVATILFTVAADITAEVTTDAPPASQAGQAARVGGDEFALYVPATADPDLVADRIDAAITAQTHRQRGLPPVRLSIGWASTRRVPIDQVVRAADAALACAKHAPRRGSAVRSARHHSARQESPNTVSVVTASEAHR
ncbi:GGDEF domain-containing protein [Cryptosporangium phraense]|uniref:GGDEF domain-containing protein n=1 Tax=Cryptosporangium phraense TaxID=2593070 RepID=UPI0014789C2C|nr:GGDEF domain-containing protein [Cryptosporangium phraense]